MKINQYFLKGRKVGGMCDWSVGVMEGWHTYAKASACKRNGGMEEWKGGRMVEWKEIRV